MVLIYHDHFFQLFWRDTVISPTDRPDNRFGLLPVPDNRPNAGWFCSRDLRDKADEKRQVYNRRQERKGKKREKLGREIIRLGGGEKIFQRKRFLDCKTEKSYSLEATNAILRKNQKREKKESQII